MFGSSALVIFLAGAAFCQTLPELESSGKALQDAFEMVLKDIAKLEPKEADGFVNCEHALTLLGLYERMDKMAADVARNRDEVLDKYLANSAAAVKHLDAEIARAASRIKRIEDIEIKEAQTALNAAQASSQTRLSIEAAEYVAKTLAIKTEELARMNRELTKLRETRELQDDERRGGAALDAFLQAQKSFYRNEGERHKSSLQNRRSRLNRDCPKTKAPVWRPAPEM